MSSMTTVGPGFHPGDRATDRCGRLRQQVQVSAIYVEPFGKRWYWQTFYNYNLRLESVDRDVADVVRTSRQPMIS